MACPHKSAKDAVRWPTGREWLVPKIKPGTKK